MMGKPRVRAMVLDQAGDGIAPGAVARFTGDDEELLTDGVYVAEEDGP